MLDLALPRPPPTIPEATVDLFEMMGLFPPIRWYAVSYAVAVPIDQPHSIYGPWGSMLRMVFA
jgi:hypothetical protein